MKTLLAILKIIRPVNILITFLSVIVAGVIALGKNIFAEAILLSAVSEAIAVAGGNIINDYFDIEIDKVNRPERILPSGKLSMNSALILYLIFMVLSIVISFFVSNLIFLLMLFTQLFIFLYSFCFKKIILAGNLIVALLVGSAFILGAAAAGNIFAGIIPFIFAFLINFSRELLKDMEDIKGDSARNVISFPNKYGFQLSKKIIFAVTLLLIGCTFYPYLAGFYNLTYLILIVVIVNPLLIYFLIILFKNNSVKNFKLLSMVLKVDMILGLAAIYFGT